MYFDIYIYVYIWRFDSERPKDELFVILEEEGRLEGVRDYLSLLRDRKGKLTDFVLF